MVPAKPGRATSALATASSFRPEHRDRLLPLEVPCQWILDPILRHNPSPIWLTRTAKPALQTHMKSRRQTQWFGFFQITGIQDRMSPFKIAEACLVLDSPHPRGRRDSMSTHWAYTSLRASLQKGQAGQGVPCRVWVLREQWGKKNFAQKGMGKLD